MLKEIDNLHKGGVSWKRMHDLGLEYRYGAMYLQKQISKSEMIEKLNTEIWHYAKRQKTWFKRDKDIVWIDPRETLEIIK
jgi:tRNA dimethylallyltransferase